MVKGVDVLLVLVQTVYLFLHVSDLLVQSVNLLLANLVTTLELTLKAKELRLESHDSRGFIIGRFDLGREDHWQFLGR